MLGRLLGRLKSLIKQIIEYFKTPKHLAFLGIGFVVFLLANYGLLVATSQPGFCNQCHEMKPRYENWKKSDHAEVGCADCHTEPGIPAQALHKIVALKELYLHFTVQNQPNPPEIEANEEAKITVNHACLRCHSLDRNYSLPSNLIMPHKKHIEKGLVCSTCHLHLVHGEADNRGPKMELCLKCHNGKKAPDKCTTCHKMTAPANHKQANWLNIHGKLSKTLDCGKCHNWRSYWCAQCHSKKPNSHQVKWRTNHKNRAKTDRGGCNACHQASFCMKCHGVAP